jgi:putative adhesin
MTSVDTQTPTIDHRIGRHGNVAIKLASAELRLTGVDGDRVVVRTPGGRGLPDYVTLETTESGLTIREREAFGLTLAFGPKTVQLEIDLPAEADVSVETASGSLETDGLRGPQRYRTVSGDTTLHAAAGRIEIGSVSGDAEIELAASAELALKSVSGDVAVSGGSLSGLRVGTTSGDVRIDSPITGRHGNAVDTLSGDVSLVADAGMRVEARTVSGDLTSDLPHRSEGRMGRRTLVVGDGSIELSFRSVSGDLQVHDLRDRNGRAPTAPPPPAAPPPPLAPGAPTAPETTADATPPSAVGSDPAETDRMAILRAIEAGEIDVATAMDRLAALDAADETGREATDA